MKILIAEDDTCSRALLVDSLRRLGHEVVAVADGLGADDVLRRDRSIRMVVTDWLMPGCDGLELCRLIRGRPGAVYTYVLVITQHQGLDARLEGYRAGADDFLAKPVHLGELAARVTIAERILAMQEELLTRSAELEGLKRELERHNARLVEMATTDALTGLRNRRHFHELFETTFRRAAGRGGPLTIVLLDVDRFKPYNDTYGHPAGDEVLIRVASELRRNVRDHDLLARYGGEEFVLLLPDAGADEGIALANRLRRCIAEHPWPCRPITASFGVATLGPGAPTPAALLNQADQALYQSKQRGRDRVTHHRELTAAGSAPGPSVAAAADAFQLDGAASEAG